MRPFCVIIINIEILKSYAYTVVLPIALRESVMSIAIHRSGRPTGGDANQHFGQQSRHYRGRNSGHHRGVHFGPALAAAVLAAAACLWPAPARADVEYTYTGNVFPLTDQSMVQDDLGHYRLVTTVIPSFVTAVIDSPVALQAGATMGPGLSFTLSRYGVLGDGTHALMQTLYTPYPFSGPFDPPDTSANPLQDVTFSIGAVNGAGLPTAWNLSIAQSFAAPTGRRLSMNYATSTSLDSISGGYEGFDSYAGALAGQPGTWRVSVVPEVGITPLLLAGLGAMGMVLRRRGRSGVSASDSGTAAG